MSNTSDAARPRTKPGEGVHTKFPVAHRAATRDRKIGVAVSSTRRPESVQDTAAGSRVMVALMVPGEVAKVLALGDFPGALSPSELHVTLADLGAVEDLTSDQVTAVREVASDVARRWPVLTGEVAGLGRFSDSHHENGLHALWLAVDVPFLEDLRVQLVARLAEAGLPSTGRTDSRLNHPVTRVCGHLGGRSGAIAGRSSVRGKIGD